MLETLLNLNEIKMMFHSFIVKHVLNGSRPGSLLANSLNDPAKPRVLINNHVVMNQIPVWVQVPRGQDAG